MITELLLSYNVNPVSYTNVKTDWEIFENLTELQLESLLQRCELKKTEEDYLWIIKHPEGYYFFFYLASPSDGQNSIAYLAKTQCIDLEITLDTTYLKLKSTDPNHKSKIEENFQWLSQEDGLNIPADFPIFKYKSPCPCKKKLIINYGRADAEIKKLPFGYYCQLGLGNFASYEWLEFISTHKDYLTHLWEWDLIRETGKNLSTFLLHSVIIVNIYEHLEIDSAAEYAKCLKLFEKLKNSFKRVQIGKQYACLNILINPVQDDLLPILADKNTWFVFANFHTENLQWTLPSKSANFYKNLMTLDLSHIHLMRICHCYSFLEGANGKSIGTQLIEKGVKRVEGSVKKQSLADYFEYLLTFFNQSAFKTLLSTETPLQQELENMHNTFQKIIEV